MTDKSEVGVLLLSHWSSKPGEMDVVMKDNDRNMRRRGIFHPKGH